MAFCKGRFALCPKEGNLIDLPNSYQVMGLPTRNPKVSS